MPDDPKFELELPLFKAADGEGWRFEGIASTSSVDREGERITEKAINGFKQQFANVPVCLAGSHGEAVINVLSEVGRIDKTFGDGGTFGIGGEWDKDHPHASWVAKKLGNAEQPPRWKLSVGGSIPQNGRKSGFVPGAGRVAEIDEMQLNHVLLCRGDAAVNQETSIAMSSTGKAWSDVDLWEPVFKAAAGIVDEVVEDEWSEDDGNLDEPTDLPPPDDGCVSTEKAVSERPWSQVEHRGALPDSAYLYVKEQDGKNVRKFPVYEGSQGGGQGSLNRAAVFSAAASLGSTSPEIREVVAPKLMDIYRQHGWPLPTSLTEGKAGQEDHMDSELKRSLPGRIADMVTALLSGDSDEAVDGAGADGDAAAKADEAGGDVEVPEQEAPVMTREEIQVMVAKSVAEAMAAMETKFGETVTAAIEKALAKEDPPAEDAPAEDAVVEDTPPVDAPADEPAPTVEDGKVAGSAYLGSPPVDMDAIVAKVADEVGAPLNAKIDTVISALGALVKELNEDPVEADVATNKAATVESGPAVFPFVETMAQIPGVREILEEASRESGVNIVTGEPVAQTPSLW